MSASSSASSCGYSASSSRSSAIWYSYISRCERTDLRERGRHRVPGHARRGAVDRQAAQLHGGEHRTQGARIEARQQTRHDARAQRGHEHALAGVCARVRAPRCQLPFPRLLFRGRGELQEQFAFSGIGLCGGDPPVQPGRFFLVVPAIDAGGGQYSSRSSSTSSSSSSSSQSSSSSSSSSSYSSSSSASSSSGSDQPSGWAIFSRSISCQASRSSSSMSPSRYSISTSSESSSTDSTRNDSSSSTFSYHWEGTGS